ncbi:tRNA (guanosine(37)-N1)-methyltransferase TrmD [Tepidibacillus fermentans]|uniref:tRNA (guanine-N(1)-)-methyltransferase n=1 Tax=Tepidibacillus fermentans TaxID=1281767 RepID=A0A4R3K964_9BACI|nr:tRNA (guanosine(37)-N1)-methyltransferase TrmD [Tepidibacillus fermentans]TCS79211.1 tRNA (guanine37-N(1)-) methyltransferase [Tepidibacillus fermentans]
MKIDILTLFPEMFTGVLQSSILKKAQDKEVVTISTINFRDYSTNKHKTVDDYPYGGGHGMVLKPEPIFSAVEAIPHYEQARIIMLTPQGEKFSQKKAEELSKEKHLIFLCGHYEGFDERIREHLATDELSIGDYVLTGGELAAMVIIDSVTRLLPGVLGNEGSVETDSFSLGLLEYPQYTRPEEYRGWRVPDILLSGHHQNIEKWRKKESLKRTLLRRPDLLAEATLDQTDRELLKQIKRELENTD